MTMLSEMMAGLGYRDRRVMRGYPPVADSYVRDPMPVEAPAAPPLGPAPQAVATMLPRAKPLTVPAPPPQPVDAMMARAPQPPKTAYARPVAGALRVDVRGDGHFGSGRGDHKHKGIDLIAVPGEGVKSPIDGIVEALGTVYADTQDYQLVKIRGSDGNLHWMMYTAPGVAMGDKITAGQIIGTAQDVSAKWGADMNPHVEWRIEKAPGEFIDPEPLLPSGYVRDQAPVDGGIVQIAGRDDLRGNPGDDVLLSQEDGLPPGFEIERSVPDGSLPPGFEIERPAPIAVGGKSAPSESATGAVGEYDDGGPSLGHTAQVGLGGFNTGLANILGLPADLINAAPQILNLLPGEQGMEPLSDYPIGGSQSIVDLMDSLGMMPGVEPESRVERYVDRIGQEIGAMAVPGMGIAGKALQAGKAGVEAMGPVAKHFIEPFAVAPGKTAAAETAFTAGAGAGAQTARETMGDSSIADLVGALAGTLGVGQVMRAGRMLKTVGGLALDPEGHAIKDARKRVGGRLQEHMQYDPERAFGENAMRSQEALDAVPGYDPTTAQLTNDPGLAGLEYSRAQTGPNTGAFYQRRSNQNQAVHAALDDLAPTAADDTATRGALAARIRDLGGMARERVAGREAAKDAAMVQTQPAMDAEQSGAAIRGELLAGRTAAEDAREAMAGPLREQALTSGAQPDVQSVVDLIDDMLRAEKRPTVIGALTRVRNSMFRDVENAAGEVETVLDDRITALYSARKAINDQIAGRGETGTDRFAQGELIQLRQRLDEAIVAAEPAFGQYLDAYRTGSQAVEPFEQGRVGAQLAEDRFGAAYLTPDSGVAGQFFTKGVDSPEAINEFVTKTGGRPLAVQALREYALTDARAAAVAPDGTVNVKALEKWVADHRAALDAFPEVRRDLGTLAEAERALQRALRRQEIVDSGIRNPRTSTAAKYLATDEAASSMAAILRSPNPVREMDNLMRLIGWEPQAVDGARRAFWDLMMGGTSKSPRAGVQGASLDLEGDAIFKPGRFSEIVSQHGDALRVLYRDDPGHLDRLEKIAESVQIGLRVARARMPGSSGTGLAQNLKNVPGLTLAGILSRTFAIARGVVSIQYVVVETATRAARRAYVTIKEDQFQQLLDRALLDPELAKTLIMEANDKTAAILARRLRLHLGNEISTVATGGENAADKERKPLTIKITPKP